MAALTGQIVETDEAGNVLKTYVSSRTGSDGKETRLDVIVGGPVC